MPRNLIRTNQNDKCTHTLTQDFLKRRNIYNSITAHHFRRRWDLNLLHLLNLLLHMTRLGHPPIITHCDGFESILLRMFDVAIHTTFTSGSAVRDSCVLFCVGACNHIVTRSTTASRTSL